MFACGFATGLDCDDRQCCLQHTQSIVYVLPRSSVCPWLSLRERDYSLVRLLPAWQCCQTESCRQGAEAWKTQIRRNDTALLTRLLAPACSLSTSVTPSPFSRLPSPSSSDVISQWSHHAWTTTQQLCVCINLGWTIVKIVPDYYSIIP